MGRIVSIGTPRSFQEGIEKAARLLLQGGLVAYPTESFYGLGADSTSEKGLDRIFYLKARERDRPILILVPTEADLERYVTLVPGVARRLIRRFWPGGLTLVFEARSGVSSLLTAGTGKIGIRLSSHPVAGALARAAGIPITGTSANISGMPPCRSAREVKSALGRGVDMILDGGDTAGIAGTTVLDVTVDPPRILREGMIPEKDLKRFYGN